MAEQLLATPTKGQDGQISWSLCYKDKKGKDDCGNKGWDPIISFPGTLFAKTHHFEITITNDQTGMGIVFAPDPPPATNDGPLWIRANSKPDKAVIDVHIEDVKGGGTTTLTFKDKDKGNPVDLYYRLNFVDSAGKKVTAIDPEIKNGGSTFNLYMTLPTALISAAVVAGLLYLAFRTFRSR